MKKVIPSELFLLHQWFVVEESLSVIRHDLRNRLGAIRNANFYVRRQVQKLAPELGTADARIPSFLELVTTEANATEAILESRLAAPEPGERVEASSIVQRAQQLVMVPANVVTIVEATTNAHIRIAPDEAALAFYCLIENAVDALGGAGGTIKLRATATDAQVALEVEDDAMTGLSERALEPFFTTRASRMGIGVNIAKRIAGRWKGSFVLAALDRGTRATLTFGIER